MSFDTSDFHDPRIRVGKCHHEAAHAVFAHHAGLETYDIHVTPAGEGDLTIGLPEDPSQCFALEMVTILLAGEYAEYRYWQDASRVDTFDAFERQVREDPEFFDIPRARKLLDRAAAAPESPWGDVIGCHRVASEATASNVALWWPKIQAVAKQLEQGNNLDGRDVSNILEGLR